MATEKDWITENLRTEITDNAGFVVETDRADLMTITLSFQSRKRPERHVWIDTDPGEEMAEAYSIDLEDWSYEGSWDNAVATVFTDDSRRRRDRAVHRVHQSLVAQMRAGAAVVPAGHRAPPEVSRLSLTGDRQP